MIDPINVRFRELRKALGLNTTQIGDAIGLSNSGISSIETGQRKVFDKHVRLLKVAFPLMSEHWLLTGEGEMFVQPTRDEEIAAFVGAALSGEDENFKRRLLSVLSRLDEKEWQLLEKMAKKLAGE